MQFKNNDSASGSSGLGSGQQETDDYGRLVYKLDAAAEHVPALEPGTPSLRHANPWDTLAAPWLRRGMAAAYQSDWPDTSLGNFRTRIVPHDHQDTRCPLPKQTPLILSMFPQIAAGQSCGNGSARWRVSTAPCWISLTSCC